MTEKPVINFSFINFGPGVEVDVQERYQNWVNVGWRPLGKRSEGRTGTSFYNIINPNPEYPQQGSITHHESLKLLENNFNSPEIEAIRKEHDYWDRRGVRESIWRVAYELNRGFRQDPKAQGDRPGTQIENGPIMHLEGYRLTSDEQEKYENWLNIFGYSFMPLFMKLDGLKGYDFYKKTDFTDGEPRETDYPPELSILYFENIESLERYASSQELVVFQKAIRTVFPKGLNYKWYVRYRLTGGWRK
jgi:hypothetical protein